MDTLSKINAPVDVRVEPGSNGMLIHFEHPRRSLVGIGAIAMLIAWALIFLVLLPIAMRSPYMDRLLALVILLAVMSPGLILVAWIIEEWFAQQVVAEIRLGQHKLHAIGQSGGPLAQWTVHDLEEAWSSQDLFSPIVAVRTRGGEVQALRVRSVVTAVWMAAMLEEWRGERGTQPDAQAQAMQNAVAQVTRVRSG